MKNYFEPDKSSALKHLQVVFEEVNRVFSTVTKGGSDCCKLPLETTDEDEIKEATASLAAAIEISVDATFPFAEGYVK